MHKINKNGSIRWKCRETNCAASLTTEEDIPTRIPNNHNHEDVRVDIKVLETLQSLKDQAECTITPIPSLYQKELNSLRAGPWSIENRELVSSMPTYHSVKDSLYRKRKKTLPLLPNSRDDLLVPETFKNTDAGNNFLIIDYGEREKILGFSTVENLQHLSEADNWYADGTLHVVPRLFYQLYTIHAQIQDHMFPLVYFLLPNKKRETYEKAFTLMKEFALQNGIRLQPITFQMDFETAAKSACNNVFPLTEWKGCFFHFTQCIWRKTQNYGLQTNYKDDEEVNKFVRRCAALPLCPMDEVENVWLETLAEMPNACIPLADYVTTQWIEGDFLLEQWNHHHTNGPRINNNLEGWHSRIKKVIAKAHPNIFEFLNFLKSEQKFNEIKICQYQAGGRLPPKRRHYMD